MRSETSNLVAKGKILKVSAVLCMFSMLFTGVSSVNLVSAAEDDESLEDVVELIESVTSDEEEELELDDITDEELLEAEPSDLPEVEPDLVLTERLMGRMLLDVEGDGEVYYIDPVTGGKEYLADGESAQLLLRRRALGINEANFANLVIGENKDEESVCEFSDLGKRLRGRIVLRTEVNGESYYILPTNCRAYYAGTFEASYELMKQFSLGIVKKDLAKVPDNKRQKMKNALRLSVYAHAEDNGMSLKEAREDIGKEVNAIKTCMENFRANQEARPTSEENKERVRICVQGSEMPRISKERREEVKDAIRETREERKENEKYGARRGLADIDMKKVFSRVREVVKNRVQNILQNREESKEVKDCVVGKVGADSSWSLEQRREFSDECFEELEIERPEKIERLSPRKTECGSFHPLECPTEACVVVGDSSCPTCDDYFDVCVKR